MLVPSSLLVSLVLGIAEITQAKDDEKQAGYLASLLTPYAGWELYVVVLAEKIVGFVACRGWRGGGA